MIRTYSLIQPHFKSC